MTWNILLSISVRNFPAVGITFPRIHWERYTTSCAFVLDDDKCGKLCDDILEELENIDDDTDKYGIQFVKSKDSKLASEIGIFSFPALVYYETGVPIMYDGES